MDEHLLEHQLESQLIYQGKFFNLYKDIVQLPNDKSSSREYITHPGAVVVAPILEDNRIVFVKQYRYPIKKISLELPAGKLDPGESEEISARRELLEETGYSAEKLIFISEFYPCVGYSDERMHLYIAKDMTHIEQSTDHDEFIDPVILNYEEALQMVVEGEIFDQKTMLSLFLIKKHLGS